MVKKVLEPLSDTVISSPELQSAKLAPDDKEGHKP